MGGRGWRRVCVHVWVWGCKEVMQWGEQYTRKMQTIRSARKLQYTDIHYKCTVQSSSTIWKWSVYTRVRGEQRSCEDIHCPHKVWSCTSIKGVGYSAMGMQMRLKHKHDCISVLSCFSVSRTVSFSCKHLHIQALLTVGIYPHSHVTVTTLCHLERWRSVRVFVGPDRRTQKEAIIGLGNSQKKTTWNRALQTLHFTPDTLVQQLMTP